MGIIVTYIRPANGVTHLHGDSHSRIIMAIITIIFLWLLKEPLSDYIHLLHTGVRCPMGAPALGLMRIILSWSNMALWRNLKQVLDNPLPSTRVVIHGQPPGDKTIWKAWLSCLYIWSDASVFCARWPPPAILLLQRTLNALRCWSRRNTMLRETQKLSTWKVISSPVLQRGSRKGDPAFLGFGMKESEEIGED